MTLTQWAIKWGVSIEALRDLENQFRLHGGTHAADAGESEGAAQARVRLAATRAGWRLFRNNVGAGKLDNGNFIRWGLANDSKALNDQIKSSDLIGIRSDGVFVAREIKAPGWRYSGTEREQAQLRFLQLVAALGGDAAFTTGDL